MSVIGRDDRYTFPGKDPSQTVPTGDVEDGRPDSQTFPWRERLTGFPSHQSLGCVTPRH